MNRTERRVLQRESKKETTERQKNINWFRNWTPSQVQFHKQLVKEIADDANKTIEEIMDSCYIAAMLEKLDITLDQCIEVCKLSDKHMIETKNFIEKEGESYMKKVNNEELKNNIRTEAKKMLEENPKASTIDILKALKENYDLPNKDLHIICQEAREEIKEDKKQSEKIEEIPYSVTEKEIEEEREKLVNFNGVMISEKDYLEGIIKQETTNKPQLKIKSIEIEGNHSNYIKSDEGVKTNTSFYRTLEDLEEHKELYKKDTSKERECLNQQIEDLKEELSILDKREKEKNELFVEIEEVFKM